MLSIKPGDVINMGTFTAITGDSQWTFRRPSRKETFVFLFLGAEKEGEPLDLVGALENLGWTARQSPSEPRPRVKTKTRQWRPHE